MRKFHILKLEELNSILKGTYYRATLICQSAGEVWEIIDRGSTPEEAVKKVWDTYNGPYEGWKGTGFQL